MNETVFLVFLAFVHFHINKTISVKINSTCTLKRSVLYKIIHL